MMGEPVSRQDRLFYEFDLEDMVPADRLLRRIDAVLDPSWLRGELKPYDSYTGCPSVCPELMVGMRLAGYCTTIRSERRLCQEVKVNLAYRWFCGLGLEDEVPESQELRLLLTHRKTPQAQGPRHRERDPRHPQGFRFESRQGEPGALCGAGARAGRRSR